MLFVNCLLWPLIYGDSLCCACCSVNYFVEVYFVVLLWDIIVLDLYSVVVFPVGGILVDLFYKL